MRQGRIALDRDSRPGTDGRGSEAPGPGPDPGSEAGGRRRLTFGRSGVWRGVRRCLPLAVLLLAAVALLGAKPAGAHAMLLESVPADGAVLAQSPPMLLLRFDEPV